MSKKKKLRKRIEQLESQIKNLHESRKNLQRDIDTLIEAPDSYEAEQIKQQHLWKAQLNKVLLSGYRNHSFLGLMEQIKKQPESETFSWNIIDRCQSNTPAQTESASASPSLTAEEAKPTEDSTKESLTQDVDVESQPKAQGT
jgi:hypothetical protein